MPTSRIPGPRYYMYSGQWDPTTGRSIVLLNRVFIRYTRVRIKQVNRGIWPRHGWLSPAPSSDGSDAYDQAGDRLR